MAKVIIFTQNTMASIVATREVLQHHHDSVLAVVLASQLKGESFFDQLSVAYKLIKKSSLGFFMYKLVESKLYNLLLLSHKLRKSAWYNNGQALSIKELAKKYNIPIITCNNLSAEYFLETIKNLHPEMIMIGWGSNWEKLTFGLERTIFKIIWKILPRFLKPQDLPVKIVVGSLHTEKDLAWAVGQKTFFANICDRAVLESSL